MRAAATLGLVGVGGVGALLIFALRSRAWPKIGIILMVLVVVVIIMDQVYGRMRKWLV